MSNKKMCYKLTLLRYIIFQAVGFLLASATHIIYANVQHRAGNKYHWQFTIMTDNLFCFTELGNKNMDTFSMKIMNKNVRQPEKLREHCEIFK
jgi:hypothetical protein